MGIQAMQYALAVEQTAHLHPPMTSNTALTPPTDQALDHEPSLLPHLRALRVLPAVAQHGSTAAAALAIHLSQPAITRAIHKVEQACGHPLFTRTTRGMRATSEGLQLAQRTALLLEHLHTGAREALALASSQRTRPHAPDRLANGITSSQVRALLAIATHGSESQAAQALGISQPAIYAALQDLQTLLGVEMFYKLPTGTRLTPPGEAILLHVKRAVAELRGMDADMALWTGETRGSIVLGVLPLSATIVLPQALQALHAQHPGVQIKIIDGAYESLIRQLLSADIDAIVGALRKNAPSADIQQHPLFDDDLVIVARHGHACFAPGDQPLQLADMLRWPWVAPLPNTPADRIWRGSFTGAGLHAPTVHLTVGSPTMTIALVLQSGLLAMASRKQVLRDGQRGALRIVPVPLHAAMRTIGIVTRRTTMVSPVLQAFIACCQRAAHELGDIH